jgi:hypothetical protein
MASSDDRPKPKLVFFQWDHQPNANAAGYLLLHMQQQVKCLETHFDVVVINRDCDYAEICDHYEPDLALFESGYRSHGSQRIRIANSGANRHIPKLGLHNADPWCDRRAGFISDMEHWGIEAYFAIGTMTPEYMPELRDKLFVWPNFIDPDIYHDYRQHKTIPVTLTGQTYGLYPWRQKVFPLIRDRYPCLVSPTHAYESKLAARMLAGEAYARVLNASVVVPTCGTAGGEVVRKHFEVPGSNSCLVAERTEAVQSAGFVDMDNCVFADEDNVVDKLEYLFAHPEEIGRITAAGFQLVHSRHTLKHRPQIHQWFTLNRDLQPGEKIVQSGPFGDLLKVESDGQRESHHVVGRSSDRALLKQGDRFLEEDRLEDATSCYAQCLDYVAYLPEAKFRLAICALRQGRADKADELLTGLIKTTMVDYGAADPDPMEWAYFLLSLICRGQVHRAKTLQNFYPRLSHEALRRVALVLDRLGGREHHPDQKLSGDRTSIHQMPKLSEHDWIIWCAETLERCNQNELADTLHIAGAMENERRPAARRASHIEWRQHLYQAADNAMIMLRLGHLRPGVPPLPQFRYFRNLAKTAIPPSKRDQMRRLKAAFSKLAL